MTTSCAPEDIGEAFAEDGCGEVTISHDAPSQLSLGQSVITWTATDEAGNTTTATQNVFTILGDDPSCCPEGTNIIMGTDASEALVGTAGSDCILGLGGHDNIAAQAGEDFVSGGDGNDTISGGTEGGYLVGGEGIDTISGGTLDDLIDGQGGYDICSGGVGVNQVSCEGQAHCTAACCAMSCALPMLTS